MSILNMTYHGYYTPGDRTTEAIAKAVNHTWDNLERLAERVSKIESDKDATIAQLRDELASMQQRAERAEKERDEAKQYSKNVERARDQSMLNESALLTRVDVANQKLERMTKERDEALAKLEAMQTEFETFRINTETRIKSLELGRDEAVQAMEIAQVEARKQQPRMVMRDGGQLWEVFNGNEKRVTTDDMYALHPDGWHKTANKVTSSALLYRRPITPQELQAWITTDAKPVGYVNKHFPSDEYTTGCIVRDEEQGYTIPVYLHPPQPTGEVLYKGVRWTADHYMKLLEQGEYAKTFNTKDATYRHPVHVTIRKAGE